MAVEAAAVVQLAPQDRIHAKVIYLSRSLHLFRIYGGLVCVSALFIAILPLTAHAEITGAQNCTIIVPNGSVILDEYTVRFPDGTLHHYSCPSNQFASDLASYAATFFTLMATALGVRFSSFRNRVVLGKLT